MRGAAAHQAVAHQAVETLQRSSRAAHEELRVILHEETQDFLAPCLPSARKGGTVPTEPEPAATKQAAAAAAPSHVPPVQGAAAAAAEVEAAAAAAVEAV